MNNEIEMIETSPNRYMAVDELDAFVKTLELDRREGASISYSRPYRGIPGVAWLNKHQAVAAAIVFSPVYFMVGYSLKAFL